MGPPVWFLSRAEDDKVGRECGACAEPGLLLWAKDKAMLGQKLRRHNRSAHPAAYTRPSTSTPPSTASPTASPRDSVNSTASTSADGDEPMYEGDADGAGVSGLGGRAEDGQSVKEEEEEDEKSVKEEEEDDDVVDLTEDGAGQPTPTKPTKVKSVKHVPNWVIAELPAAEVRLLIAGLHRADGDFKSKKGQQKTIYTSGAEFRDQLVQVLLHGGYSAIATTKYRKNAIRNSSSRAQPSVNISVEQFNSLSATEQAEYRLFQARADGWTVRWSDTASVSGRKSSMPMLSYRDQGVCRVPYSAQRDGRTWCVRIRHQDHLIIAQRAKRDSTGMVTQQSRPVIVFNCPYHGDCLEGLANAGAVSARCQVSPAQLHSVPDSHPVWDIEAFYLANLCQTLATIVSPHVIVLGGGVLKRKCLFPKTRQQLVRINNGYLRVDQLMAKAVDGYIVPSPFDADGSKTSAGCIGSLELARLAYEEVSERKRTKAAL